MSARVVAFLQVVADEGAYTREFIKAALGWSDAHFNGTLGNCKTLGYLWQRQRGANRTKCFEITPFGLERLQRFERSAVAARTACDEPTTPFVYEIPRLADSQGDRA